MGVRCRKVVRLGGRIGELAELKPETGNFGRCRWVVPPFGKVFADN